MGALGYSVEDSQYIEDNWGVMSITTIAKNLNRPVGGIVDRKDSLGLGSFLSNGEYISINQFFIAIGRRTGYADTLTHWVKKGFPLKTKKVLNNSFKIIYLNDFWKWAKEYRMHIDFNKFKENVLGAEPTWVKDQRRADIEFSKYKLTPWTNTQDNHLKSLLKLYKYTYKALSLSIFRTEGAIKRRMVELKINERPLREIPHGVWSEEQIKIVIEMYNKGYRGEVIKEYINKSGQAINGKIERLIRDGFITKWK
ncbi:hypothetical protein [Clostridium tagluense]|uniref:hypothetical protein n=1 Tax=Clostridium tagluense TaxID=360422 RepID=UPI001CF17423|nr:hypothetical protein [Clostridium tagluense]MCB2300373.1 hypothetical protein [Clostridium tagluense]